MCIDCPCSDRRSVRSADSLWSGNRRPGEYAERMDLASSLTRSKSTRFPRGPSSQLGNYQPSNVPATIVRWQPTSALVRWPFPTWDLASQQRVVRRNTQSLKARRPTQEIEWLFDVKSSLASGRSSHGVRGTTIMLKHNLLMNTVQSARGRHDSFLSLVSAHSFGNPLANSRLRNRHPSATTVSVA